VIRDHWHYLKTDLLVSIATLDDVNEQQDFLLNKIKGTEHGRIPHQWIMWSYFFFLSFFFLVVFLLSLLLSVSAL
jgi:hypothetical protein